VLFSSKVECGKKPPRNSGFIVSQEHYTLLELLAHQDEDVRATAAVALGKMGQSRALPALQHMALTDTNHETTLRGLWVHNSSIAQQSIHILLHPEQEQALDWPE